MTLVDTVVEFTQKLKNTLTLPLNTKHHLLATRNGKFHPAPAVIPAGIVESDEELGVMQGYKESFEVVFNQWQRFSRSSANPGATNANPGEMQAWNYLSATDQLICTINSTTYIGFISNKRYSRYTLETRLRSNNGDDDWIGLCAAVAVDSSGNTHTLDVLRALNGTAPLIVAKNYMAATEYLAQVYSGLKWSDGTVATGSIPGNQRPGWNSIPNGILLKVTREDDIITVETSQYNESTYYEPAKTVIDLSADPKLAIFRGGRAYGYACRSQMNSTWDVLQRSGDRLPIIDVRTFTRYEYENGAWAATPGTLADLLSSGALKEDWLHYNSVTGKYHYVDPINGVQSI